MKTSRHQSNQAGFAHILIVIGIVVLVGIIGFVGWKVVSNRKDETGTNKIDKAAILAACKETDKNICKFIASWKDQKYYTVKSTTTNGGKTYSSTYQAEGANKYHTVITGDSPYDVISIDNTTYTKAPNGVWWKQTSKPEDVKQYKENFNFDDAIASDKSPDDPANTVTYKNLGTEACDKLTCYKYQVVDSSAGDDKEFIWFDTKDYQLRKLRSEAVEGVTESTFSYEKVSISVPSPMKELGPNQYLLPGQNEPTTLPTAPTNGDLQSLNGGENSSDVEQ